MNIGNHARSLAVLSVPIVHVHAQQTSGHTGAAKQGCTPNTQSTDSSPRDTAATPRRRAMKLSNIKRTLAGLSLVAAVVGGLTFSGGGRAYASGDAVDCSLRSTVCQGAPATSGGSPGASPLRGIVAPVATTMAPEPDPYVDLAITLVGQNLDGSPNIQISNLGNEGSGQFQILQLSVPDERQTNFPGLAAGQSIAYHDPSFPADCGTPVEMVIAKHTSADRNPGNDILKFTPSCGLPNAGTIS